MSSLPWVLPCLLFMIFLQPLRIRSSLQHTNLTSEKHSAAARTTSFLFVPSHSTTGLFALYLNCFLSTHELNQSILVRFIPLQINRGAINDLWLQEEAPSLFIQPVLWSWVLLQHKTRKYHIVKTIENRR